MHEVVDRYRRRLDKLLVERKMVQESVKKESTALEESKNRLRNLEETRDAVQALAERIQQNMHNSIAGVVSRCLSAIFDDPYEFKIRFEKKRNKTEAKLIFVKDGEEYDDPLNEVGGGVIDVAAFALRVASVLLSRPAKRRLLVLDEPFRNIRGKENRSRTKQMVEAMANDLGFQFVLNVDIDSYPEFGLGKVVEIGELEERHK